MAVGVLLARDATGWQVLENGSKGPLTTRVAMDWVVSVLWQKLEGGELV